jgi:putative membrane protein
MPTRLLSQALAAAFLLGAACVVTAQSSDSDAKTGESAADTVFIENAAKANLAEIQLGKTALDKSSDGKVKSLAQRIVDDHTKANAALKTLADNKKVSFPSDPTDDAKKENAKLQAMKPAGFDQAWSKDMVNDHQDAIKLFTAEAKDSKDADIQQFVKTTLPTLKSHLAAAQKIAAVPDARDQAMDQASKSMTSAMDSSPATASTAAASTTTAASTTSTTSTTTPAATPAPAAAAVKTTAPAAVTAPAATSGAKH